MCLITIDQWNGCTDKTCPYRKECAQHETAGDFRSEDGFKPILKKRNGEIHCFTKKEEPVIVPYGDGNWDLFPPENATDGIGMVRRDDIKDE